MRIKNIRIILVFFLLSVISARAQEQRTELVVEFRVNRTELEPRYSDNPTRVPKLVSFLRQIDADSTLVIRSVTFCGAASPEGDYQYNKKLALGRMKTLEALVRSYVDIPDSIIEYDDTYILWTHLYNEVEKSDMSHKEEILAILKQEPEIVDYYGNKLIDKRILELKKLNRGRVWNELFRRYFRSMRNAGVIFITFEKVKFMPAVVLDAPQKQEVASQNVIVRQPLASFKPIEPLPHDFSNPWRRRIALRTNLLADVALIPNVGLELHAGRGFTIGANWMYAWWRRDSRHRYWRIYGGDVFVRKYFGGKAQEGPFRGHHLGIYGQVYTYDFELGKKGVMGGKPGGNIFDQANYGFGLEYGYSVPIGKCLCLDFSFGLGYFGGKYSEYLPMDDCYVWQATKKLQYLGPIKAEISLVWQLGRDKAKKGGRK